jgi:hypothetical protein
MMKKEKALQDHIDFLKEGSLMTRRLPGGINKMIWISLKVSDDSCSAEVRKHHVRPSIASTPPPHICCICQGRHFWFCGAVYATLGISWMRSLNMPFE